MKKFALIFSSKTFIKLPFNKKITNILTVKNKRKT